MCIDTETNCLASFQFQTQKVGIGLTKEIGGVIGIGPGGASNLLDQLYLDGQIGAKMYAFYNPSTGGEYDMKVRVGEYDPKLLLPETTQAFPVPAGNQWRFVVSSIMLEGKDIKPHTLKYARLYFGGGYSAFPKEMYVHFCKSLAAAEPLFKISDEGICAKEIVGPCPTVNTLP